MILLQPWYLPVGKDSFKDRVYGESPTEAIFYFSCGNKCISYNLN